MNFFQGMGQENFQNPTLEAIEMFSAVWLFPRQSKGRGVLNLGSLDRTVFQYHWFLFKFYVFYFMHLTLFLIRVHTHIKAKSPWNRVFSISPKYSLPQIDHFLNFYSSFLSHLVFVFHREKLSFLCLCVMMTNSSVWSGAEACWVVG